MFDLRKEKNKVWLHNAEYFMLRGSLNMVVCHAACMSGCD